MSNGASRSGHCLSSRHRPNSALPPIRAIRTGHASRPRCRKSRSPRYGQVRHSTTPPDKWKNDAKVSALVSKLAARKTPLEEAEKAITEFLAGSTAEKAAAGKLLFAGLFETLNAQRTSVLNGLERVTRKQREAADKIRADTLALQALQGASPPDQPKIDELSNQLIWETRIFEDRRRVIKFVCEVPTAIDQRLFALGRMIQQEME